MYSIISTIYYILYTVTAVIMYSIISTILAGSTTYLSHTYITLSLTDQSVLQHQKLT